MALRLTMARFPFQNPLEHFEFKPQPGSIPKWHVNLLVECHYLGASNQSRGWMPGIQSLALRSSHWLFWVVCSTIPALSIITGKRYRSREKLEAGLVKSKTARRYRGPDGHCGLFKE